MKLVDWWLKTPSAIGRKLPAIVKAILIPWFFLGILIALIPELQKMPDGIRLVLGLPAALGILWMIVGLLLSVADKLIAFGSFVRGKREGTR